MERPTYEDLPEEERGAVDQLVTEFMGKIDRAKRTPIIGHFVVSQIRWFLSRVEQLGLSIHHVGIAAEIVVDNLKKKPRLK